MLNRDWRKKPTKVIPNSSASSIANEEGAPTAAMHRMPAMPAF